MSRPLVALAALALASAPALAQDEAARLVPADAAVLVRFESVEGVLALVHAFDSLQEAPVPLDANLLLSGLGVLGDVSAVDAKHPLYFALSFDAKSMGPMQTWVVPTTDPVAYLKPVSELGALMPSASLGSYVGLSQNPGYAAAAAPSALATRLAPGLVSAHVDLGALMTLFGPMIQMGLTQAEQMIDTMPVDPNVPIDVQPMMESYFAGLRVALDSAQGLDFAIERAGDHLGFSSAFTARAGSALDGWESPERIDLAALSGLVDPKSSGQMVLAVDWQAFMKRFGSFLDAAIDMYPAALADDLDRMLTAQEEVMALLQPGLAVDFDIGPDGIRAAYVLRSQKPAEVVAAVEKAVAGFTEKPGFLRMEGPARVTVEGLEARTWKMKIEIERLMDALQVEEPGMTVDGNGVSPSPQAILDRLYGSDLRVGLVTKGEYVLLAIGNGDAFLDAPVRRLNAPTAAGPAVARLLQRSGGGTPSLVYHLDLGQGLGQIMNSVQSLVPAFPGTFTWPDQPLTLDAWGSIRGPVWSWGTSVSLAEILGFARAMRALDTTLDTSEEPETK